MHLFGMHIQTPFIFFKESNELIEDVKDCILLLSKLSTIETVSAKSESSDKAGGLSWTIWERAGSVFWTEEKAVASLAFIKQENPSALLSCNFVALKQICILIPNSLYFLSGLILCFGDLFWKHIFVASGSVPLMRNRIKMLRRVHAQKDLRKMVLVEMWCSTTCILTLSTLLCPDTSNVKHYMETSILTFTFLLIMWFFP